MTGRTRLTCAGHLKTKAFARRCHANVSFGSRNSPRRLPEPERYYYEYMLLPVPG